ncbi:MAG: tRNA-(ms[2]io[6]A)-hydroxylase [Myxococcota bacterium]
MLALGVPTAAAWTEAVLADFDRFLVDHAAAERKASATGMSFVVRYPDRPALLGPLIEFAREELGHFAQVVRLCHDRGLQLAADTPDPYVGALLKRVRTGRDDRLLDRLLCAGVVEARGCERFGLLAHALPPGPLQVFYEEITRSEARHHGLFVRLASETFDAAEVEARHREWLAYEAEVVAGLPVRAALH